MSARSSVHAFEGSNRPYKGWIAVVVIHVVIGYALISGMAQKGLHLLKKPLEAVVIQEVVIPPKSKNLLRHLKRHLHLSCPHRKCPHLRRHQPLLQCQRLQRSQQSLHHHHLHRLHLKR